MSTSNPTKDKPKATPVKKVGGAKGGLKGVVLKKKASAGTPAKPVDTKKSTEKAEKPASSEEGKDAGSTKKRKTS